MRPGKSFSMTVDFTITPGASIAVTGLSRIPFSVRDKCDDGVRARVPTVTSTINPDDHSAVLRVFVTVTDTRWSPDNAEAG